MGLLRGGGLSLGVREPGELRLLAGRGVGMNNPAGGGLVELFERLRQLDLDLIRGACLNDIFQLADLDAKSLLGGAILKSALGGLTQPLLGAFGMGHDNTLGVKKTATRSSSL